MPVSKLKCTVKAQTYSIETIFEKKLLFLIPFYIFSHESRFADYETNADHLQSLKAEYQGIKGKLEELAQNQEISEYTKCTILDMSGKVLNKIAERYDCIKEEVASVMAGPVLEYEARAILNKGRFLYADCFSTKPTVSCVVALLYILPKTQLKQLYKSLI